MRDVSKGWPMLCAPESWETVAQRIRKENDARYSQLFPREDGDMPWVGEIGEFGFYFWLKKHCIPFEWITKDTLGKPDFIVNGKTVDLKTVKRKRPVLIDYTCQVAAKQAQATRHDWFFFASYEYPKRILSLLGAMRRDELLLKADYYGPGDWVHPNYQIRDGHAIYNVSISQLVPPHEWLRMVA